MSEGWNALVSASLQLSYWHMCSFVTVGVSPWTLEFSIFCGAVMGCLGKVTFWQSDGLTSEF